MLALTVPDNTTPFATSPTFGTSEIEVTPAAFSSVAALSFASVPQMAAFDATATTDGAVASTATIVDQYMLVKAPSAETTASIDGVNIVAATLPVGAVWVRLFTPHNQAWQQTAWAIDPVAGSDVAAGTALAPLKSLRELGRRWRGGLLSKASYTVSCAAGDVGKIGELNCEVAAGTLVLFQAALTSTAPRALGAVTATNMGTNTRGSVGDAGGAFARSQRLRMVSGAAAGALTFCQGGTVAATAVVAGWSLSTTLVPPLINFFPAAVEPAIGDQYVTDTYATTMRVGGNFQLRGSGRVAFKDFNLTTDPSNAFADRQAFTGVQSQGPTVPMSTQLVFTGCQFDANAGTWFTQISAIVQQSIFFGSVTLAYSASVAFNEVVFQSTLTVGFFAFCQGVTRWTFDGGRMVVKSATVEFNGGAIQAGATATGGNAIEFLPNSATYWHAGGRLWGPTSGYAVGVRAHSFTGWMWDASGVPTLVGSTNDANIGGTNFTWATMATAPNTQPLIGVSQGIA